MANDIKQGKLLLVCQVYLLLLEVGSLSFALITQLAWHYEEHPRPL